jgi:hypothetical protein
VRCICTDLSAISSGEHKYEVVNFAWRNQRPYSSR